MTITEIIRQSIRRDEMSPSQSAAQEFRDRIDEKLETVAELGEARRALGEAQLSQLARDVQLARDTVRLTRGDLLEMLQLLSALESWSFSLKVELPDYLHARLDTQIERVKAEILGEVST